MKETNDLAYQLFQDIQQGTLEYCYRGVFNRSITESILSLAETNLEKEKIFHQSSGVFISLWLKGFKI